jgi:uncharacterized integral membrane protein (TIGR00697 family)
MIDEIANVRPYKYLTVITGLFVATLLISNVLNSKVLKAGPVPMTGGLLLFPLAYLFSDVLTEVYGYSESRKTIWTGAASLLLLAVMIEVCGALPAASSWSDQEAYRVILGRVPRIVAASMIAYLVGDFSNSYVLAKFKIKTEGRHMSSRFVCSTIVGQFFDTSVFVLIAFSGVLPTREILAVLLSGWIIKVAWEVVALPITIPIVNALKQREHVDYFDTDTNFSPLQF